MGGLTIQFSPRAQNDIADAFHHYRTVHLQLAARFMDEMQQTLFFIQSHPNSFQHVQENSTIRRAVMHSFPHIIAYDTLENSLIILRVRSSRQNPSGLL